MAVQKNVQKFMETYASSVSFLNYVQQIYDYLRLMITTACLAVRNYLCKLILILHLFAFDFLLKSWFCGGSVHKIIQTYMQKNYLT